MNRLIEASFWDIFRISFNTSEIRYLRTLARSVRHKDRIHCLIYIDTSWSVRRNHSIILPLLDKLVMENRERQEALERIARFAEPYPEEVWPYILKYGSHPNRFLREAVAASVLPSLLFVHHTKYFAEIKRRVLGGDRRLLDTLIRTRPFWKMSVTQWHRHVRLIKQAGGDLDRVYVRGRYQLPPNL
jgi:hypothetical protein